MYKHDIQRKIRDYILCNFLEIAVTNEEMLRLSCEDLLLLIRDDALNTKTEKPIWEFCLRWIEFDKKNRLQSIPSLLEGVRLGLLDKIVMYTSLYIYIYRLNLCSIFNKTFCFRSTLNSVCFIMITWNCVLRRSQS